MPSTKKLLQAAAGSAGGDKVYVEDVFSTFLYTGTASSIVVNNGLDLSGEGGLTWLKSRSLSEANILMDTVRGVSSGLASNNANDVFALTDGITAFNSNGFTLGTSNIINTNASTNVSWSFRKAKKFFDVVTYTGSSNAAGITVAHNLGSVPAMIIIKNLDNNNRWYVWIKGFANNDYLYLNEPFPKNKYGAFAYLTANSTSTTVSLARDSTVNYENSDYVMYLFGDEAAFGDDGDESMVKCGVFTGTASTLASVNLGFEPQFIMIKATNGEDNWRMHDDMRGWNTITRELLNPNTSAAGSDISNTSGYDLIPTATGFDHKGHDGNDPDTQYSYMAIRRPMKTPEAGTEVFATDTRGSTGTGVAPTYRSPWPVDMQFNRNRTYAGGNTQISARLLQKTQMFTDITAAESSNTSMMFDYMNGVQVDTGTNTAQSAWMFKRAPGFMDVVAYRGNGVAGTTVAHNLGAAPELIMQKVRSASGYNWYVYAASVGINYRLNLDATAGASTGYATLSWNNVVPAADVFTLGSWGNLNGSGINFISYLFATLAGVSKVGSYTGTGADLNVDCGFSAGARFILIKRTDSTGDWYYWDSARGIVAGNDPYLLLNSTAAEVANTDYIDPLSSGFTVTSSAPAALNASGGSYLFLAIS